MPSHSFTSVYPSWLCPSSPTWVLPKIVLRSLCQRRVFLQMPMAPWGNTVSLPNYTVTTVFLCQSPQSTIAKRAEERDCPDYFCIPCSSVDIKHTLKYLLNKWIKQVNGQRACHIRIQPKVRDLKKIRLYIKSGCKQIYFKTSSPSAAW